ncbi:MAG: CotH kinase family protein [Bacteroidaceae bacterium]|nr:CotH kinase family protein [Bacteroidaceae bacterium]
MKKKGLLLACAMLASVLVQAETSPWTGSMVGEGVYYLYNVGTGLWLQNNDNKALNQWSTRAEAGSRGLDISVSPIEGGWQLNPRFGGNHSINGYDNAGYLDTSSSVTAWKLMARHVQGVSNAYTISSGTTTLGVDDDGFLTFDGSGSVAWQLVTREERIANLLTASTDNPLDASWLIQNPDFALNDERYSAWNIKSSGGNTVRGGTSSDRPYLSCHESWNSSFINFSQTIENIPLGIYRLSVQGFYRDGSAGIVGATRNTGNETIRSVYFANEVSAPLLSICDNGLTEGIAAMANFNSDGYWIPDHTDGYSALQNAAYCFNNGLYQNPEIEVLVTDGTLTIGIRKDEHVSDDWTVFDSFTLTYCGTGTDRFSWVDVTSDYIVNPSYDNDSNDGWEGTDIGHAQAVSAGEHWNKTFDTYQTIRDLPNGAYRISVQTYYRQHDPSQNDLNSYLDGNDNVNAYLYANNDEKKLISYYSEYSEEELPGTVSWLYNSEAGANVCYPHSMIAGVAAFEKGMYWNSIETEVTENILTIGLYCDVYEAQNWCLFDNWKLEYWTSVIDVKGISLTEDNIELGIGDTYELSAEVSPYYATFKGVTWTSSDPSVASIDRNGMVTALKSGTVVITARSVQFADLLAQCLVRVVRNDLLASSLVVNEIMSANIDSYLDPSWNYGGFVELYNPTDASANLAGCYISDDLLHPLKWHMPLTMGSIPAHGYKTIWFDHYDAKYGPYQANFKLNTEGGTVCISDDQGNLLVTCEYPAALTRCAWARTSDGADEWKWTSTPTPGKTNNGSTFADEQLEAPTVSRQSCGFNNQLAFSVRIPDGCTLRYTTDGSTPTMTNGTTNFSGSFKAEKTTVYRFRLFKDGTLPSPVVTRTFYKRERDYKLPILSVVANNADLYGSEHGIFATGPNGRAGNGRNDKCNWNMDWDRPANFELIDEKGNMVVNQEVDIAVCGGWSRAWNPRSFKLKAQKQYEGKGYIDYTLFEEKPYIRNKTIQVRNGGNDKDCRIKDAALQRIVSTSGLDVDYQAYLPVHHFINGQYKGVINMREPNNKHFVLANYGYDTDEIDQFEISPDSNYIQMTGTKESFDRWYELAANAADDDTYAELCKMVDIDEFINYIAVEFYLGNWDWPKNNLKGYRPRTEDGRFRLVLFDLDGAFNIGNPFTTFEGKRIFTFDALRGDYSGQLTAEIQIVTIFLNMLQNDQFRKQFIDSYCLITGSVFEPSRCAEIVSEMANFVSTEMSYNNESPWSTANDLINRLNSNYQSTNIRYLKNYSRMKLSGTQSIQATLMSDIDEARLLVNGLPVPTGEFSGELFPPITVSAQAPAGYVFKGWKSTSSSAVKVLFSKGSTWKYYDQGSLDGKSWQSTAYNDQSWKSGQAPLGYFTSDANNQRGYKTFLDYGGNTSSKRPTYYFRKNLTLSNAPASTDVFTLNFTCDDGFVIYVNGTKAGSYLMPSSYNYSSYASTYAPDNPDSGTLTLSPSLFRKGDNLIAVEVHNNSASSTDIYWDGEITQTKLSTSFVSTETEYELPSTGPINLMACYEEDSSPQYAEGGMPIRINEVSPANDIFVNEYWKRNDWIELYNASGKDVDITGMYLSDDVEDPLQFQITKVDGVNNVIPAHGFAVVWCDKLEPINTIHTSFKLASEGGYVILTSEDEVWGDTLQYCACDSKHSVGLYPDGGASTYMMNRVTIGASNQITTADTIHTQTRPEGGSEIIALPEEPTRTDDVIYDLFGRRVLHPQRGTIYIINGRKKVF